MINIRNNDVYFTEIEKSLKDKLFFLDKIQDIDLLVDFGCGNGHLMDYILRNTNVKKCFGYDYNTETIVKNKNNYVGEDNIYFSFDFYDILSKVWKFRNQIHKSDQTPNLVIIFSSVFHEMDRRDINAIIQLVYSSHLFDYVVVRDMFSFQQDHNINFFELADKVKGRADPVQVEDFEDFYGEILLPDSIIHFLLKQRYKTNWELELEEDYLQHSFNSIKRQFENTGYELLYDGNYCNEFLANEISEQFNIDFKYLTHGELIYKL